MVDKIFRFHGFKSASRANGPGSRMVVWFQGCTLNCKGCGNPETHKPNQNAAKSINEVKEMIRKNRFANEGITFSGGEPLQQPGALIELMQFSQSLGLTVIVSTGYTINEIERMGDKIIHALNEFADVVIAGRYNQAQHIGNGFRGSANKEYRFISPIYSEQDFESVAPFEIEIDPETGAVNFSGVGISPFELEALIS